MTEQSHPLRDRLTARTDSEGPRLPNESRLTTFSSLLALIIGLLAKRSCLSPCSFSSCWEMVARRLWFAAGWKRKLFIKGPRDAYSTHRALQMLERHASLLDRLFASHYRALDAILPVRRWHCLVWSRCEPEKLSTVLSSCDHPPK